MNLNLKTMHICGNILTTKDCSYFALRCVNCQRVFGIWSSFIKHLVKCQVFAQETWTTGGQIDKVDEFYNEHCSSDTSTEEDNQEANAETTAETRDPSETGTTINPPVKHLKVFNFSLRDPEYASISQTFVKLLRSYPALWDKGHAHYGMSYTRVKCHLQLKFDMRKLGYAVTDEQLRTIIPEIVQQFKETKQMWDSKGVLDKAMRFFVEECQFLDVLLRDNAYAVEEEQEELMESLSDSEDQGKIDTETVARRPYRRDIDPKAPVYTLVSSKHKTQNKRIRFHLVDSDIVVDFIKLVRDNPVLWDTSHPNFNRYTDRKTIITGWIAQFEQKHKEVFTYDDFALNLLELRRYYSKLGRRKNLDDGAKKMMELLKFMPMPMRKEKIKCDHCDKLFLSTVNYQGHLYKEHNIGESPFKCKECGKLFVNSTSLQLHMKQVHLKKFDYACTLCDRSFLQPSNLEMHMAVHTGEKRFICETCGKGFRKRINLSYHETRIHLRQRNFSCDMCPKAFYTKSLLKDHINSHLNIRNYKCPFCSKAFHSSHALMRHKQIHSDVKRYVCKMCDARFSQFVGLNAHMKSRHQFVQDKCADTADRDGVPAGDYDDPSSSHESVEVKGMEEYVYNFDYDKNS